MSETGEKHSTRVPIMMSPSELRVIDEWRRGQPDLPSRAEAIRRLIRLGLTAKASKPKSHSATRLEPRRSSPPRK